MRACCHTQDVDKETRSETDEQNETQIKVIRDHFPHLTRLVGARQRRVRKVGTCGVSAVYVHSSAGHSGVGGIWGMHNSYIRI